MLSVKKLSCGYGKSNIINNVSFDIQKNEISSILGANGSGKTTLLKAIYKELNFTGDMFLNDQNIKNIVGKNFAKKVGVLTQMNDISFEYSVYDTVLMGRYPYTSSSLFSAYSKNDTDVVNDILFKTDLFDIKNELITNLSGGQLQRVLLAKVFAQDPQLIILDEPTNHLDLKYQIEIMSLLKEWVKQKDKMILSVIHDVNLALSFSDTILLMKDGNIINKSKTSVFNKDLLNDIYNTDVVSYMKNAYNLIWK